MPKRKTPKLALFGEYVSSQPRSSEDVHQARRQLIELTLKVLPEFLRTLSSKVFPLFEQLAARDGLSKPDFNFQRTLNLWPCDPHAAPYDALTDEGGLKAELAAWAHKYNANVDWVVVGALRTLQLWRRVPEARMELRWDAMRLSSSGPLNSAHQNSNQSLPEWIDSQMARGGFELCHQHWNPQLQSWVAYREVLRKRFDEILLDYEKTMRRVAEASGLVATRRQYSKVNLEWFILRQFAGMTLIEIVERSGANDESTVLKGVNAAKDLIAWDHGIRITENWN
jgi:hypothetical protein